MLGYLYKVARCEKTPSKSTFWAVKPTKKNKNEEEEGAEEVNGGGRHSLLSSGRCRTVGGDRMKSGHVTTWKGKRGKDLCQGPSWPGRKRVQKRARWLAYSCDGKGRNLEKKCSAGMKGG
jgi:hypothetical protein